MKELNKQEANTVTGGLPIAFWVVYVLAGPAFSAGVAVGVTSDQ